MVIVAVTRGRVVTVIYVMRDMVDRRKYVSVVNKKNRVMHVVIVGAVIW
jgi:hypothetical protein